MSKENTAVAVRQNVSLQINDVDSLIKIGELFDRSGMFGCTQQGQGMVLAMTCVQAGMTPLEFIQTYHIIEGRPSMRADAMLAKFVERGGTYKIEERSDKRAAATFTKDGNVLKAEFTLVEAQQKRLIYGKDGKTIKTNWDKWPKQMLWARLVSDNVRTLDPGVNMGTYTPEEVSDFDDAKTVHSIPSNVPTPTVCSAATQDQKPEPEPTTASTGKTSPGPAANHAPDKSKAIVPEVLKDNFDKVPCGKLTGKRWSDLTSEQWSFAVQWPHPAMTDQHREKIKEEIAKRKPAAPQSK
jgi:hypothetical protein